MAFQNSVTYRYLGIALLCLCAVVVTLRSGNSLRYSDESDYEQLARSLIHGHTFAFADGKPTAYRPPGYPAFIAAAYAVDARPITAKIENVLFLVLAALVLVEFAGRIHPNAAVVTPFLLLAYPLLLYAASVLYPQVLGCLLLTVAILLISDKRLSGRRAAAAGLVYGILILAIPYFFLLLPVLALYVIGLAFRSSGCAAGIRRAALFLVGAALVVTPWTARNYLDFHKLIPVSANGGWNLFIGNSPATTPNGGVIAIDIVHLCKRVTPGMEVNQIDSALGKCALDWVAGHPWSAGKLYVEKVINYFNFRNELATQSAVAAWSDWLLFATYYPLLLIAIVRASLFRRYPFGSAEALVYILYFSNAFISAIYFTRIRFRIPFDFILIAVEAAFLCRCWEVWRGLSPNGPLKESD